MDAVQTLNKLGKINGTGTNANRQAVIKKQLCGIIFLPEYYFNP
jgi:hypothetical protein